MVGALHNIALISSRSQRNGAASKASHALSRVHDKQQLLQFVDIVLVKLI